MTVSERNQHERVFVHAGRLAFSLGVDLGGNPYREHPYRTLWERGWRSAKKHFYGGGR